MVSLRRSLVVLGQINRPPETREFIEATAQATRIRGFVVCGSAMCVTIPSRSTRVKNGVASQDKRVAATAMETSGGPEGKPEETIRVAAAGDVHCRESHRAEVAAAFAKLEGSVDMVLLAGDLTTFGEPGEAQVLADACRQLPMPVIAVLGNHDLHGGRADEVTAILREAGVEVLERSSTIHEVRGHEVGIAGAKGFVGGFGAAHLPRLAAPIVEHQPDLVLHGHAHAGRLEGRIGDVPVCNVSVPVIERDFWIVEMSAPARSATPIR